MATNSLVKEFNYNLSFDYKKSEADGIFNNREELELLRKNILAELGTLSFSKIPITKELVLSVISKEIQGYNLSNIERNILYNIINDEINGFGPLTAFLRDENVEEIMVNAYNEIYAVVDGKIIKEASIAFINNEHIIRIVRKLLTKSNIKMDNSSLIETTLADGSLLTAVLPPLSKNGPVLSIKKNNKIINDMSELIKIGTLTPYMARFLEAAVKAKLNIIISGGSQAEKASILSSLVNMCHDSSRIVTISDTDEIRINKKNVVNLCEGKDMLKTAVNLRPNTLVINDLKKDNITSSIDIMVDNSINVIETCRNNNALEVINSLESVYVEQKFISSKIARETMLNAIDLILVVSRLADGRNKVTSILELNKNEKGEIVLKEIFAYRIKNISKDGEVNGEFHLFKYIPRAYQKIKKVGIDSIDDIFNKSK